MTPLQRQQLETLLREHRRLAESVEAFGLRMESFLAGVEPASTEALSALPHTPPPLPESPRKAVEPLHVPVTASQTELPPLPREPARVETPAVLSPPPLAPVERHPPLTPPPPPLPHEPQSLEMTLGTVWLARIGIIILVTGLVFLGNYAYLHIVHRLGPGGKISLLCLAAAALGGAGAWLQRRPTPMGLYPQVLLAGGAAVAYYTTYAAHFVERLRVIQSPLTGGALLLAVAGVFVWWSDRRKLQTAALLGILLSYYTAAINPIGSFTLFSSVLLTAAGGFFLVRRGWALLSWATLAGTYASYAYWRFYAPMEVAATPWALPLGMLGTYWALFTASVFLARAEALSKELRAGFLTLNNGLFFALATEYYFAHHAEGYWAFTLLYGVVLLALAALARHRRAEDFALDGAYLWQGLAAVTAGLALKLTGPSLAIALAVEGALLLTAAGRRHGVIFQIGAGLTAIWAALETLIQMEARPVLMLPLGGTVAALLLFDAWWLKQRCGWLPAMRWSWRAAGFAGMGLALTADLLLQKIYAPWEPSALAVAALLATASVYLLRLPEVVLLGQLLLALAVEQGVETMGDLPLWHPLPVIGAALALAHWWQKQRLIAQVPREGMHLICAVGLIGTGFWWGWSDLHGEAWVLVATLAAAGTAAYGCFTRAWAIAVLGQVFTAVAIVLVYREFGFHHFAGPVALLPLGAVAVAGLLAAGDDPGRWPPEGRAVLPPIARLYWWLGCLLWVGWVFEYVAKPWQLLTLGGAGALLLLSGARWPSRERAFAGLGFYGLVFVVFWLRFDGNSGPPTWQELLALLLPTASWRLARRLRADSLLPARASDAMVALTTASVWLWVTRWTWQTHHGHLLTLAWSGLAVAVFIAGLTLRDRIYRIGGFCLLALATGRIFAVDVWRLETVFRILSFLGLGLVLLALGFVYNRYADKIRRWL